MSFLLTTLLISLSVFAQQAPSPGSTRDAVQHLVDDLSDPAFAVRQAAVNKLYAAGPKVLSTLADVSKGDDFEAALRARDLIKRIQKLFLVGAKIELSASQPRLRWDEPISIRVKIINPSEFPIHLPFLIRNRESIDSDPLAVQMGNLLDAADFLQVLRPDGEAVELHVDDLRGQPSLERALDVRAYDEPASLLAPNSEFVLTLPAFNRGLARYRLFHQGTYRVQFDYVPEWEDEKLRDKKVGRVVSDPLSITVTQPAPDDIVAARRELKVSLHQVGQVIVVRLTSTHDRDIGVNLNIGGQALREHARLEWHWDSPGGLVRARQPAADAPPLAADKLIALESGRSVDVFKVRLDQLKGLEGFEKIDESQPIRLAVKYSNILDRALLLARLKKDQANKAKWQALYDATPLPTFVGWRTSDFVDISLPMPDGP